MAKINVKDTDVTIIQQGGMDYVSITDIARFRTNEPNVVIGNWMRNRNTIEYLGMWEYLYNPGYMLSLFRLRSGSRRQMLSVFFQNQDVTGEHLPTKILLSNLQVGFR